MPLCKKLISPQRMLFPFIVYQHPPHFFYKPFYNVTKAGMNWAPLTCRFHNDPKGLWKLPYTQIPPLKELLKNNLNNNFYLPTHSPPISKKSLVPSAAASCRVKVLPPIRSVHNIKLTYNRITLVIVFVILNYMCFIYIFSVLVFPLSISHPSIHFIKYSTFSLFITWPKKLLGLFQYYCVYN